MSKIVFIFAEIFIMETYTIEDLKRAFEAGESLKYKELASYEGIYDGDELNYEDFETWLEYEYKED